MRTRLGDILALFNQLADTQSALEYLGTVLYYIGMAGAQMTSEEMATAVKSALADKGSELMQTIARQWIAEGIEQGIEQGLEQGRLQTLADFSKTLSRFSSESTN